MEQTKELLGLLNNSNDRKSLSTYLKTIEDKFPSSLSAYIKKVLKEKKVTPSVLIKKSKIERTYCYQIINGRKKPGRDKVIAISLALELSIDETQTMLTVAKEGVLYPKSKRDSILIYAVNNHYSVIDTNLLLAEYNEPELN